MVCRGLPNPACQLPQPACSHASTCPVFLPCPQATVAPSSDDTRPASSYSASLRFLITVVFKNPHKGLPWWRSGWESACQCRGHGFEPWSGKIPHAAEQVSPRATTTEPALWSPRATLLSPRAATTEPACRNY